MRRYLERLYDQLKSYECSLVKVSTVRRFNEHAKEYLIQLANLRKIEKIAWGWYYITPKREPATGLEFLVKDRNFKILVGQTAASFWNQDFIHRDVVSIAVNSLSYKRALEILAKKRGWSFSIRYDGSAANIRDRKFGGLLVEDREQTVIDCMKRWAFVDAIAVLAGGGGLSIQPLLRDSSWVRVAGSNVRVRQAIKYAANRLSKCGGRKANINDDFIRAELDEAIDKVRQF